MTGNGGVLGVSVSEGAGHTRSRRPAHPQRVAGGRTSPIFEIGKVAFHAASEDGELDAQRRGALRRHRLDQRLQHGPHAAGNLDAVLAELPDLDDLSSANIRSRRCGHQQVLVMQPGQHRLRADERTRRQSMSGFRVPDEHEPLWRIRDPRTQRHVWASVVVMIHP
jgi:hypothetical protein